MAGYLVVEQEDGTYLPWSETSLGENPIIFECPCGQLTDVGPVCSECGLDYVLIPQKDGSFRPIHHRDLPKNVVVFKRYRRKR